jgi:hypothetical protein
MKAFSTLVPAVLAASLCVASLPAHADVIAQFQPAARTADFRWVKSAGGTGGHLFSVSDPTSTVKQGVASHFTFFDPALADMVFLPAVFTIDATVDEGNAATFNAASQTFTQTGLTGSFHFTYSGADTIIDGISLVNGEDLLSGDFTDAWIQGFNTSGSVNLTVGNGGSATFKSAVADFSHAVDGSQAFALNLLSVKPGFHADDGKSLDSFTGAGGGNLAQDVAAGVPEPATWGLMIVGFGGIGALMRSKRRRVAGALA